MKELKRLDSAHPAEQIQQILYPCLEWLFCTARAPCARLACKARRQEDSTRLPDPFLVPVTTTREGLLRPFPQMPRRLDSKRRA